MTKTKIEKIVTGIPILGALAKRAVGWFRKVAFSETRYWESRYTAGGNSGAGSHGELAAFKAEVVNTFVQQHRIRSVVEFGCGDGAQLLLADYPAYTGLDVSRAAVMRSIERFHDDPTKSFFLYDPDCFVDRCGTYRAELALSLDVLYHLVDDKVFHAYMRHLFSSAERFVVIYSSDTDESSLAVHVRHRRFSAWINDHLPHWRLQKKIANPFPFTGNLRTGSFADFCIYERT
ncbi:hypothetical protein BH24GEM2_BH24GEM2_08080 [soil metagenome]|jgi:SAM-dependent methyltransferase|nr:class I SAM-dependent methyltransferase [Gemmatimonadota bacterium]